MKPPNDVALWNHLTMFMKPPNDAFETTFEVDEITLWS